MRSRFKISVTVIKPLQLTLTIASTLAFVDRSLTLSPWMSHLNWSFPSSHGGVVGKYDKGKPIFALKGKLSLNLCDAVGHERCAVTR